MRHHKELYRLYGKSNFTSYTIGVVWNMWEERMEMNDIKKRIITEQIN